MAPPSVLAIIERHRPRETLQNMALIIIDQTYTAALEIVGGPHMADKDGIVNLSRPIDPADPNSPVLTVHAGNRHCCIAFNNTRGDAEAFMNYTSPKGKSKPTHRLERATISISPGTLHLARVDRGRREDYWSCADVRPDVANRKELAILDAIAMRLEAAIRVEGTLLRKANASKGLACPRVAEIDEVFKVLQEMRREMDVEAFMRRRQQKRRGVEEITGRPAAATHQDQGDETEILTKRLKMLRVSSSSRLQMEMLICTENMVQYRIMQVDRKHMTQGRKRVSFEIQRKKSQQTLKLKI